VNIFSLLKKYKQEFGFLVLISGFFLIWYLGRYLHLDTDGLARPLRSIPLFYGALVYILLYVLVTFFIFFSKDIFWVVGAVLFGAYFSTLFISIAETINAFILFYLSRYLGRAYLSKSLKGKYKDLDRRLGRISFFWLFIFRAAPLIPYRFLDIALGLTRIHFRKYLAAVILGTPVKMFWIQYILAALGQAVLRDPKSLVGYFLYNRAILWFSLMYLGLIILVVFKWHRKV